MSEKVWKYHPELNPNEAYLPGVGLRDLTEDEVAALPGWLRPTVETCGWWVHDTAHTDSDTDTRIVDGRDAVVRAVKAEVEAGMREVLARRRTVTPVGNPHKAKDEG